MKHKTKTRHSRRRPKTRHSRRRPKPDTHVAVKKPELLPPRNKKLTHQIRLVLLWN